MLDDTTFNEPRSTSSQKPSRATRTVSEARCAEFNDRDLRQSELVSRHSKVPGLGTLPQYFRNHDYLAWGGGKLYHQSHVKFSDATEWDHVYSTRTGAVPPSKQER